jgi:hypothetical protein
MKKRRQGRGRLSSIDLLPDDAEPVVAWAKSELRERKRLQIDIHAEFNERLRALDAGIEPISLSAFNRCSIRLATTARRLQETREITAALAELQGPREADDLTLIAGECIKTLIFELTEAGPGDMNPRGAMELARALHSAVSAQSVSTERRRRLQAEFATAATAAVDTVARSRGLTAETVEAIKGKILGIGRPS